VRLQHAGRPIGLLPAALAPAGYADHSVTLAPGDRIYLFTDGIPEAADPSEEEFGFERLEGALCDSRADSLQASVDTLVARVETWCGETGVADDVSVLAIEF
ncbi:MAG TPA: PP2C family protein-serine/threonine phosphatase, partial [Thermoanaerobaculaceae bacterium]|nr:PP2C family protein-serine/threonine phosphatase [Thermoanaerobaculaceae bacterium]